MSEAVKIYARALSLGLDIRSNVPANEINRIFNGVGAEWMPDGLRAKLDGYSEALLPAVMAHDIDYAYGNGTMLDFQMANRRLEANGRICADATYAWWHPMRYLVRRQAKAYARICDAFGFPAYADAVEKTNSNHEGE